ncbi:MAG: amidohydrolase family protein [Negativicutes bacterium]|nr:amidohydrolase family protein [Negativicutes bacterium]
MAIIDAHVHLGPCRVFGWECTEQQIITSMDSNGVDASIVQPFPGAPDPVAIHDEIARMAEKYPGRIFGLASINPHQDEGKVYRELVRCVKELGFVGIKCHTLGHALLPVAKDADVLFETANELKVPMMVHNAAFGIPFTLPALLIPRAKQYPELPIIIGHSGAMVLTPEAIIIAGEYQNLYLETSWTMVPDIKWAISAVGADRVMMGSDSPENLAVEMAKYRVVDITEEERRKALGGTARRLFKLPVD